MRLFGSANSLNLFYISTKVKFGFYDLKKYQKKDKLGKKSCKYALCWEEYLYSSTIKPLTLVRGCLQNLRETPHLRKGISNKN